MRVSVRKDDPCYSVGTGRFDVYVDGVKLDAVFMADDALGEVGIYVRDKAGEFVLNGRRDAVMTATVRGEVKIVPIPLTGAIRG